MKCNQCNKEIVSKNSKKFCNSSCAAIYNNKNRQYTPSLDKRTKDTKCKTCGIDLSVNIRADLSKCKCNDCYTKRKKHIQTKRKFSCICVICGKEFKSRGWVLKTCSDSCYMELISSNSRNNPNCGGTRNSKRSYYKGILMDSSWEVVIAEWLDENNINWQRSRELMFKWTDAEGKRRRYYPDFYLPKYDVYLDPKNDYGIEKDTFKLQQVVKEHKIRLIYGSCDNIIEAVSIMMV